MPTDCVTLWIGDRVGPVERACLRSVLRQGHSLSLYCYRKLDGIPNGVELRDASAILPMDSIFRGRGGSVAFFADWFRYELQRRGLGTWVDTDIYLLAPLDLERPYLFGEQEPGFLNNAILRVPQHSEMLPELLKPFEQGTTPHWLSWPSYLLSRARELATGKADLSRLPWGTTGPDALTAVADALGLAGHALAPPVFYPVPWQKAAWIRDPALELGDMVVDGTIAIHLWNDCIKGFKDQPAPAGSFLSRLHREGQD